MHQLPCNDPPPKNLTVPKIPGNFVKWYVPNHLQLLIYYVTLMGGCHGTIPPQVTSTPDCRRSGFYVPLPEVKGRSWSQILACSDFMIESKKAKKIDFLLLVRFRYGYYWCWAICVFLKSCQSRKSWQEHALSLKKI